MTMERSAEVVTVEVTVEVLFPGIGSGVVLLTLAVLTILPVTLLFQVFQLVPPLIEYWGLLMLAGTTSLTETPRASLVPRF